MPSAEQAYEDLERDRATREGELRLIERYFVEADNDADRAMLARSLVLLTYAHLEGFTKSALITYAAVINGLKIRCHDAALPLAAATLNRVFASLREVNIKHPLFKDAPLDHAVQLQARHHQFIEQYDDIMAQIVDIPDSAIDTGQNLSPRMLKRALYQLGLNYPAIEEHADTLNRLLGERNAIAHGDILQRPKSEAVEAYISASFSIMLFVQQEIFQALDSGAYRRKAANET